MSDPLLGISSGGNLLHRAAAAAAIAYDHLRLREVERSLGVHSDRHGLGPDVFEQPFECPFFTVKFREFWFSFYRPGYFRETHLHNDGGGNGLLKGNIDDRHSCTFLKGARRYLLGMNRSLEEQEKRSEKQK